MTDIEQKLRDLAEWMTHARVLEGTSLDQYIEGLRAVREAADEIASLREQVERATCVVTAARRYEKSISGPRSKQSTAEQAAAMRMLRAALQGETK